MTHQDENFAQLLSLQTLEDDGRGGPLDAPLADIDQVTVELRVCVGGARMRLSELRAARQDQVIPLDREVESPVDVMVGDRVIARGQLVAVEDCFAVRLTELPRR
jgi:flagellar motor switch protein FliN/FliY